MNNKPIYISCSDEISTIVINGFNPFLFDGSKPYEFTFTSRICCSEIKVNLLGNLIEAACLPDFNTPKCVTIEQKVSVRFSFMIGCDIGQVALGVGHWDLIVTDIDDNEIFKTNSVFITQ